MSRGTLKSSDGTKLGTVLIAYSVYALCASVYYGPIFIWTFLAAWAIPLVRDRSAFRISVSDLVVFAVPLLALLSTAWSLHSDITTRGATQYLLTVAIASLAAQTTRTSSFARGVFIGAAAIVIHSVIYTYVVEPEIGRISGIFASPNQLGVIASLVVLFGAMLILVYGLSRRWVIATLASMGLATFVLIWSDSVTSMVSLGAALVTLLLIRYIATLSRNYRRGVMPWMVVAVSASLGLMVLFLPSFHVLDFVGREGTLSGRTEIWEVGLETIGRHTVLGTGYQAFWVPGNADAERLWDAYNDGYKTGFHFHNLFIQIFVDLGVVGFVVFIASMVSLLYRTGVLLFADHISRRAMVYLPVIVLYLTRSTSEVDFFGPFSVGTLLVFFVAFQSTRLLQSKASRTSGARHALVRDPFERSLLGLFRMPKFARKRRHRSRTHSAQHGRIRPAVSGSEAKGGETSTAVQSISEPRSGEDQRDNLTSKDLI